MNNNLPPHVQHCYSFFVCFYLKFRGKREIEKKENTVQKGDIIGQMNLTFINHLLILTYCDNVPKKTIVLCKIYFLIILKQIREEKRQKTEKI